MIRGNMVLKHKQNMLKKHAKEATQQQHRNVQYTIFNFQLFASRLRFSIFSLMLMKWQKLFWFGAS